MSSEQRVRVNGPKPDCITLDELFDGSLLLQVRLSRRAHVRNGRLGELLRLFVGQLSNEFHHSEPQREGGVTSPQSAKPGASPDEGSTPAPPAAGVDLTSPAAGDVDALRRVLAELLVVVDYVMESDTITPGLREILDRGWSILGLEERVELNTDATPDHELSAFELGADVAEQAYDEARWLADDRRQLLLRARVLALLLEGAK